MTLVDIKQRLKALKASSSGAKAGTKLPSSSSSSSSSYTTSTTTKDQVAMEEYESFLNLPCGKALAEVDAKIMAFLRRKHALVAAKRHHKTHLARLALIMSWTPIERRNYTAFVMARKGLKANTAAQRAREDQLMQEQGIDRWDAMAACADEFRPRHERLLAFVYRLNRRIPMDDLLNIPDTYTVKGMEEGEPDSVVETTRLYDIMNDKF